MTTFSDNERLQEYGYSILWTLTSGNDVNNKQLVVDSNGLIAIINAMQKHQDSVAVQQVAYCALEVT